MTDIFLFLFCCLLSPPSLLHLIFRRRRGHFLPIKRQWARCAGWAEDVGRDLWKVEMEGESGEKEKLREEGERGEMYSKIERLG